MVKVSPKEKGLTSAKKNTEALYQIKVTLEGSKPPIWRRFTVKNTITLKKLHKILQIVMGWENCHLYKFEQVKRQHAIIYKLPDPEDAPLFSGFGDLPPDQDVTKTRLFQALAEEKQKLSYFYDMGDYWEHTLVLEKILPMDAHTSTHPVCLKGVGACPPEDFGGIWCYQEFREALEDPKHPAYQEAKERLEEWLDGKFDPNAYDLEGVNKQLGRMKI
jgi:Plasmid pRiA4b ORF-3-like protein